MRTAILSWVDNEIAENRNDTIHDFLAYLAEQMIEMNKRKNEETKGFLIWLEREIGTGIEELNNKTAVMEFHGHSFEHLLEVLKKNRKKLSVNLSDRSKQDLFERHFVKSMSILEPLKIKISATDELIDEIVFRLYGLNKQEIGIVRGEN